MKKELKKWVIEPPTQEEIKTTIQICSTYLKSNQKYETSRCKQFFYITCLSQKKWFLIEFLFSIASFLICQKTEEHIYFLSFVSILLAGLMMLQVFRNLSCNVWELENSCMVHTNKVFLYKLLLMGTLNIFFLFLLSLYTTMLTSHHFLIVFSYGAFPFFLTSAIMLDLGIRWKNNATFIVGFMSGNILSYMLMITIKDLSKEKLMIWILLISVIYGVQMIKRYMKTIEQEGGLLWS